MPANTAANREKAQFQLNEARTIQEINLHPDQPQKMMDTHLSVAQVLLLQNIEVHLERIAAELGAANVTRVAQLKLQMESVDLQEAWVESQRALHEHFRSVEKP